MSNPADYKYSSEHEWISPAVDGVVTLGISDFAQAELGEVVYVDLPSVGVGNWFGKPNCGFCKGKCGTEH